MFLFDLRRWWHCVVRGLGFRRVPYRRERGVRARPQVQWLEERLTPSATSLTLAEVQAVADAAVTRWVTAGVTAEQVQVLRGLHYQVANLGGNNLAQYRPDVITVDDDAGSNLWFVEATPNREEEFSADPDGAGTFLANPGSLADGKIDLLTVLMHEQGHALGLVDVVGSSDNVMGAFLDAGARQLPFAGQASDAVAGSITTVEYLTSLPAGSSQPQPIDNRQPYLALNYAIALFGIFPSQNLSGAGPLIGSVDMFAGNFAPVGWALCQGQVLAISENETLFNLIGTTYGGDGQSTFALPDLRGRAPIGTGTGPDGRTYVLGQKDGVESVTLGAGNLPSHTHTVPYSTTPTSATGQQSPSSFENRQPTLALTPVITVQGIFPSQNLSSSGNDLLGSVNWFAGNFAPRGTALADGQLLQINQNQALFSLLGTAFGGNGQTTFALPNLQGRIAVGVGNGVTLGEQGGTNSVTLSGNNLPAHVHGIPNTQLTTGAAGGSQPFDNRQPYLGLNFDIALQGVFPQRTLGVGDPTGTADGGNQVGQGFLDGNVILDEDAARQLIDPVVQQAIRYWQAAGIDGAQIARLLSVQINIGDLPSGALAQAGEDVITLDRDASNRGWFIDLTPGDNVEFDSTDPHTGELVANAGDAGSHYDLLTAIMHEQGHILGLNHVPLAGDIMYGGLSVGARRFPTASDLLQPAQATADEPFLEGDSPLVASVGMFASNFAPKGWAETHGQLLPISPNTAIFSLLGTFYGGDGKNNFALPNLDGRAAVGTGQLDGVGNTYDLGQTGGTALYTLAVNQIPSHTHDLPAGVISINRTTPAGQYTHGSSVTYTITFVDPTPGLTAANLHLTGSGNAPDSDIGTPTTSDGGQTWTVTISNLANVEGDVILSVVNADNLTPTPTNTLPFAGQTYTLDHVPPGTSTIGFPANAAIYTAAGWDAGNGTPAGDLGGSSSDATSGVQKVELSILQVGSGKYWDGTGFTKDSEFFVTATGTTSWAYAFPASNFPADGAYTVHVRATDKAGNAETGPTAIFIVDNSAPTVTGLPSDGTTADIDSQASTTTLSANWAGVFADAESGVVRYEWAIGTTSGATDVQAFTDAGTATSASNNGLALTRGQAYFVTVRATNGAGLQATATSDGVMILRLIDLTLTKTDDVTGAARPGATITYTLTYGNVGPSDAAGVVITEMLPAGLIADPGNAAAGWVDAGGGKFTFTVGTLAAGTIGQTVLFKATVASPVPAGVSQAQNTASIADDGTALEQTPGDNAAERITRLNTPPVAMPDVYSTPGRALLLIPDKGDGSKGKSKRRRRHPKQPHLVRPRVLPGSVLANDTDADGDRLTVVPVRGTASGALLVGIDGAFIYIPNGGFQGTDSFVYRVFDGFSLSAPVEVVINVTRHARPFRV